MARSDLSNHAKTLSEFTMRFDAITKWQEQQNIKDARHEEREKYMTQRIDSIYRLGQALLASVLSGMALALIAFFARGGFGA